MDSLSNLCTSLDDDTITTLESSRRQHHLDNHEQQLTKQFKAAALQLTTLYRNSLSSNKASYEAGYLHALTHVLDLLIRPPDSIESLGPEQSLQRLSWMTGYLQRRIEAMNAQDEDDETVPIPQPSSDIMNNPTSSSSSSSLSKSGRPTPSSTRFSSSSSSSVTVTDPSSLSNVSPYSSASTSSLYQTPLTGLGLSTPTSSLSATCTATGSAQPSQKLNRLVEISTTSSSVGRAATAPLARNLSASTPSLSSSSSTLASHNNHPSTSLESGSLPLGTKRRHGQPPQSVSLSSTTLDSMDDSTSRRRFVTRNNLGCTAVQSASPVPSSSFDFKLAGVKLDLTSNAAAKAIPMSNVRRTRSSRLRTVNGLRPSLTSASSTITTTSSPQQQSHSHNNNMMVITDSENDWTDDDDNKNDQPHESNEINSQRCRFRKKRRTTAAVDDSKDG